MKERLQKIYDRFQKREYRNLRQKENAMPCKFYEEKNLAVRSARRLLEAVGAEKAMLFKEDKIGMMRTLQKLPPLLTECEAEEVRANYFTFDGAQVGNISSDYASVLRGGLEGKRKEIETEQKKYGEGSREYYELYAMNLTIDAVYALAEKYKVAAEELQIKELAYALGNVPYHTPRSYYEALVMMRLLNFTLWLNANKHNTIGRFDVYMFPYFQADIASGKLTREEALELTSEFFIDLNFDADLYPGVQQGDNGQSMVLGGKGTDGKEVFNELSKVCLDASLQLNLIDPKINIRVGKDTPYETYYLGTLLTKQGLGFPQYSNDDVVIPALVEMGYEEEDARNYVVAACWEFIIPGVAYDIPNIDALSYPKVMLDAVEKLETFKNFPQLMAEVKKNLIATCKRLVANTKNIFVEPSPFQSVMMTSCIKEAKDIADGSKYNNYGFHGAGLSTAADSLAAIKKLVYDEKKYTAEELKTALTANFKGYEKLHADCIAAPKMGNNDDYVDEIAVELTDCFADGLKGEKNERGGIFRAGTGSAMYYIWLSEHLGATPDGRYAGDPFSANYSPSLNVKFDGVLSVIHSFTKPHLNRVCNGGPLTLEFHDTLFRNDEGTRKVAQLVKLFVENGGHQIQLNAINRDTLLDAQKHPKDHKNLIVRVWGWSGYFNELDIVYQNHIIKRLEFLS